MDELNSLIERSQLHGDAYGPRSSHYVTGTLREPRIRVSIAIEGDE